MRPRSVQPVAVGSRLTAESARGHGVANKDMLHAYSNPFREFELDEGFTMVIGANRPRSFSGLASSTERRHPSSVHAMRARGTFLR